MCPICLLIALGVASVLAACVSKWSSTAPPILGVYRRPGRWYPFKFLLAYTILVFRKWYNGKRQAGRTVSGYGLKSRSSIEEMERPQALSNHRKAIDAVYVSGFDRNGNYVVTATGRCQNRKINGFAFLRVPEVGLLKLPKLPDSVLEADKDMSFSAEGILIEPVEAMKKWKVAYDGPMKFENYEKRQVHVTMALEFTSELDYFDFDTDMPPAAMARALAREYWSRSYFQHLKEAHQTHYEQMGALRGTVTVEGYGTYKMDMHGYRDHSYGHKREWCYMHRYGLHSVALEDGTMFTVGIVSQPITLSTLEIGYLYRPDGKLCGVEWCDLPLYRHGENGTPPMDYAFRFGAGGETYLVQVDVVDLSHLNMGLDWEARFVERFCRFTVNGLRGWGISEWEYRRHGGRPKQD